MEEQKVYTKPNATVGDRISSWGVEVLAAGAAGLLFGLAGVGKATNFAASSFGSFTVGALTIVGTVVMVAYIVAEIMMIYNRAQTIGQSIMNIQVVHADTEKRVSFWRYVLLWNFVGRTLVIGAIPFINLLFMPIYMPIDYLFILGKERRALHDRIAGARVVYLPEGEKRKKLLDFTKI